MPAILQSYKGGNAASAEYKPPFHAQDLCCHAWKKGTPPALLMDIFNHSSYTHTRRYLGIDQDDRDAVFLEVKL
ncbi:MAG: hypothetical protein HFH32_06290 [Eubacterium sp.]|nr:hypothetical protein [Eubacterium sp.]